MAEFIELTLDIQRNPKLVTAPVTVNTAFILKIEPRKTFSATGVPDEDGGAMVTLSNTHALPVVESYESLKERLILAE